MGIGTPAAVGVAVAPLHGGYVSLGVSGERWAVRTDVFLDGRSPPTGQDPSKVFASVRTGAPDFREVFDAHYAYVCASLRRLGVGDPDREDAPIEVFLRVHAQLGEFDCRRPMRAWLFALVARVASEFRRSARRAYSGLTWTSIPGQHLGTAGQPLAARRVGRTSSSVSPQRRCARSSRLPVMFRCSALASPKSVLEADHVDAPTVVDAPRLADARWPRLKHIAEVNSSSAGDSPRWLVCFDLGGVLVDITTWAQASHDAEMKHRVPLAADDVQRELIACLDLGAIDFESWALRLRVMSRLSRSR